MADLEITELKRKDEKLWEEYVLRSDQSTFYHQLGWRNVIEKTYGHDPIYLVAKEDGEIRGILPLFFMKSKIFGKKIVSVPFAPYGGACADNEGVEKALIEEAKRFVEKFDVDYLELRYSNSKDYSSMISKSFYATSILELSSNSDTVWINKFKKDKRKMIKRSEKKNLSYTWSKDIDAFYSLFLRNMRDLGSPAHKKFFFESILQEFPEGSKVLEVKNKDKVIYAAFYLFFKERMINSWSSTLKEYRKHLPTEFGIWKAIKFGCENGFRYYDFGRSQLNSSNFEFKRRWGTKKFPLYYSFYLNNAKSLPDNTLENTSRRNFTVIWSKMPVLLTKILGPRLRGEVP